MIDLYDFIKALNEASLPKDIINPSAAGMHAEVILQSWKVKKGQRFCTNFVLGEMGAGLPHSIGACLATKKRVIHIEGDGGFQLNIQELETVRRLNLPIIMFIINNNGYGSIRRSQMKNFGRLTGADDTSGLTLPSLSRVAWAYEIDYYLYDCLEWGSWILNGKHGISTDNDNHFSTILTHDAPYIVEVMVNPNQQYRNRVKRVLVDGEWVNGT